MWNNQIFCVLLFAAFNLVGGAKVQFHVIRQWRYFNFTWPTSAKLSDAVAKGMYLPENIVASGVVYHKDWFYVTLPRMKTGVPATLGRFTALEGGTYSPLISPYPSWELNEKGNCSALQNVQNVEIDLSGKIWIVDGGHSNSLTPNPTRNCPPKLIIFDIEKNLVEKTYIFPESVVGKDSFLYEIVLDDDFAYITDNSGRTPGIVVYSMKENRSWKVTNSKSMRGESLSTFIVNEVPITSPINVAGIAISPKMPGKVERTVYYTPLSSLHLYSITNLVLRNETSVVKDDVVVDLGLKISPTDGMIMSNKGALYYGLLSNNSIARWDTQTPFDNQSNQMVVTRDPQFIQWTNSFTFDDKGNLIVFTDTLQKFIYGTLNIRQRNFWLLSGFSGEKSYLSDYEGAVVNNTNGATTEVSMGTVGGGHISRFNKKPSTATTTTVKPSESTTVGKDAKDDKSSSEKNRRGDILCVIMLIIVISLYHK